MICPVATNVSSSLSFSYFVNYYLSIQLRCGWVDERSASLCLYLSISIYILSIIYLSIYQIVYPSIIYLSNFVVAGVDECGTFILYLYSINHLSIYLSDQSDRLSILSIYHLGIFLTLLRLM